MDGALLVCLLCLQGALLVNALNCVDKETSSQQTEEYMRECVGDEASKATPADVSGLKSQAPSGALGEPGLVQLAKRGRRNTGLKKRRHRPGIFSTLGITMETVPTKKPPPKEPARQKRHLDRERNRPKKPGYPGSTSVTGQPMRLMMAERSRRQLPHTKPKRKPRVGSFSLLSHKQPRPLQVTRVRRQLTTSKKKSKKKPPPGWLSPLGGMEIQQEPVTRVRRQLTTSKKKSKKKPPPGWLSPLGGMEIQQEPVTRVRRQLTTSKKKSKKKPPPGWLSPLGGMELKQEPVIRVTRQLHNDKEKKKKEHLRGRLSILGKQTPRVKRNLPPKKRKEEAKRLIINACDGFVLWAGCRFVPW